MCRVLVTSSAGSEGLFSIYYLRSGNLRRVDDTGLQSTVLGVGPAAASTTAVRLDGAARRFGRSGNELRLPPESSFHPDFYCKSDFVARAGRRGEPARIAWR